MARSKRPLDEQARGDVDNIHPAHQKRLKYTEDDAQLAKIYNDLADEVLATRIKAAGDLLRDVSTKSSDRNERLETAETRLIRGLCSSRKAARQGFSIALVEVLRLRLETLSGLDIHLSSTIDRIVTLTHPEGNVSGQERRDYLLGRCFAFQAVLKSDIGLRKELLHSQWTRLTQAVFELARQKQWLRRECVTMLYEYLVSPSGSRLGVNRVQAVVDTAADYKLLRTPEGVGLWLTVQERFPDVALPKGIWHHKDPLSSKERQTLSKVILENTEDDAPSSRKGGTRQSAPGFVWTVVLSRLYNDEEEKHLAKFWKHCVAIPMFSSSSSAERRALGLQMFSLAISTTPRDRLSEVFHVNILRCILDQRADQSRNLFDAAKAPLNQMINRSTREPESAGIIVRELLNKGAVNFDQQTKAKTVESIIGHADGSSLMATVATIQQTFITPRSHDEDPETTTQNRMLADLLLMTVRSHKHASKFSSENTSTESHQSNQWLKDALTMLVKAAYPQPFSPSVTPATALTCRSRLMSCLNSLMDNPIAEAACVLRFAVSKALDNGALPTESSSALLIDARTVLSTTAQDDTSPAFTVLLSLCILQIYNEEADAISALDDLMTYYHTKDSSSDSITMVIELLLSFISKPSALFRKLAEQVFSAVAAELTSDGLQSFVDILSQKETLRGQQELFDQPDADGGAEDSAEDDVEVIDAEDASGVVLVNGSSGLASGKDRGSDDGNSDSSDEEEGAADADEEIAAFNGKLAEALKTGLVESDSDDDGSSMNSEQMAALDPHLTTIFKDSSGKTSKKQEKKDAKENIINFKNRVLDLLKIYVKGQFASVFALDLILPLTTLVRTTTSHQTAEKAFDVLRLYFETCTKRKGLPQPEDREACFEVMNAVHQEMKLGGSKMHANACSRSSLFLSKVLAAMDQENLERVVDMYAKLQKEWSLDSSSMIQGSVFTEWLSWIREVRRHK